MQAFLDSYPSIDCSGEVDYSFFKKNVSLAREGTITIVLTQYSIAASTWIMMNNYA
jgi:hypothetical protein